MDTLLRHFIHQSLAFHLHENAIFLSERLLAEFPSIPHLLLVAQCYYESNQYQIAYHLLKEHSSKWDIPLPNTTSSNTGNNGNIFSNFKSSSGNDKNNNENNIYNTRNIFLEQMNPIENIFYLFSLCCIKLEKYTDAERYLLKIYKLNENQSIINYWLGIIYQLTCRKELAIFHFQKAFQVCPLFWSAFERLTNMGCSFLLNNNNPTSNNMNTSTMSETSTTTVGNSCTVKMNVDLSGFFDENKALHFYQRLMDIYGNGLVSGSGIATTIANNNNMSLGGNVNTGMMMNFGNSSSSTSSVTTTNNTNIENPFKPTTIENNAPISFDFLKSPSFSNIKFSHNATSNNNNNEPTIVTSTPNGRTYNFSTPKTNNFDNSTFLGTNTKTPNISSTKNFRPSRQSIGNTTNNKTGSGGSSNNGDALYSSQQTPNSVFFRTPSPQHSPSSVINYAQPNNNNNNKNKRKSQVSNINQNYFKKPITFESERKSNITHRTSVGGSNQGSGGSHNNMEEESNNFSLFPSQPIHTFPTTFKTSPQRMYQLNTILTQNEFMNYQQLNNNQPSLTSNSPMVNTEQNANISLMHWQSILNINYKKITLQDVKNCFQLLLGYAIPYQYFAQYKGKEAIHNFQKLPPNHYQSGWVLTHIGKSYFEMAQYENAEKAFERIRLLEPYRLDGLEIYSTILWHLKKDKKLSHLAQHMSEIDAMSPQTLCTIGNCFSQQKDHESALKYFERATKVDNLFTYAYTLAGHEHFANDDLDGALQCYRHAIRIDDRHYNAWYGIGTVYFKQEKYHLSLYHFSKAIEINTKSSVLYCYAGMALSACGQYDNALKMFNHAIKIHPQNPMPKFKKANVLMSCQRYEEALKELNELKQMVPKESQIYFTCGKIYTCLKQKDKALYDFNIALDLESTKENPLIKEAIAKIYEEENMEMEEEEEKKEETTSALDDDY
ncbi:hypothetical protein ABK040_000439 [Willaertia magna]